MRTNKSKPKNQTNKGKRGAAKSENQIFSNQSIEKKSYFKKNEEFDSEKSPPKKTYEKADFKKPLEKKFNKLNSTNTDSEKFDNRRPYKSAAGKSYKKNYKSKENSEKIDNGTIRLNKYIANSGICSRREADNFIKTGVVTVNGEIVDELGYKVKPGDKVHFGGKLIKPEQNYYILLNKPKDYITTSKDPQERKTVMRLISNFTKARVYPVGRLDRNTTGLLLFTNDGELADKLMHPRKRVKKIYHVELDKNMTSSDFEKICGVTDLEDGPFKPDVVAFTGNGENKKSLGIEIHSGKNRIVRRLFEHYGYKVVKLDRVYFAGLTKKNLPRKEWRFLEQSEINMLKMI